MYGRIVSRAAFSATLLLLVGGALTLSATGQDGPVRNDRNDLDLAPSTALEAARATCSPI